MNTKSKAKIQKFLRQCLRTALAVLVLLGVLLPAVPVANLGAAPSVVQLGSFETPIYLSTTRQAMRDPLPASKLPAHLFGDNTSLATPSPRQYRIV